MPLAPTKTGPKQQVYNPKISETATDTTAPVPESVQPVKVPTDVGAFGEAPGAPAPAPAPAATSVRQTRAEFYAQLGKPENVDQAFEQLKATAVGKGEVRRHTDNVTAWNMKWDLVTKATKTFDFSYFSIERDAYGYAYLGALLKQRLAGVEITGITDWMANSRGHGFSSAGLGSDYLQELVNPIKDGAGREVPPANIALYNTLGKRASSLMHDGLTYKLLSSDHDKMCVADAGTPAAEGETGGRNVAGAYHQDPKDNPKSWRDDSIQIKGPVNDGFVAALRRELAGPSVTHVKPDLYNLSSHVTELLVSYAMMENWVKAPPLSAAERASLGLKPGGPALSDADKVVLRSPDAREKLAALLFDRSLASLKTMPGVPESMRNAEPSRSEVKHLRERALELAGDLELFGSRAAYDTLGGYLEADVKIIDQVGAATSKGKAADRFNEIAPDLLHLMKGAQKEIVIENPYVVLTGPMLEAFEEAAKRGVKITIVTNSPESTDSAITQGYFLNDWKEFEARVPTARIFVATGLRKFHAKTFVVDGKVAGDTSFNADLLSGRINGEIGAVTRSEENAKNLLSAIYDDLKNPANKFSEWTIERDASGKAVRDGNGDLVAIHGPDQDVSLKLRLMYKGVQLLCDAIAQLPHGRALDITP